MTLRLVLVSLVAALGLTIPGVPMIESWVASTQNWMNARFADWDTRNPETPDYVIVSDYYDGERLAPHQQITLPFLATTPRASAIQDHSRVESANPTNLGSAETPATVSAHLTQVRPASFVRSLDLFKPIEVGDSLSLGFADELNRRSDGLHATTVTATPGSQPRTPLGMSRMASSFTRGLTSVLVRWNALAASLPPRDSATSSPRHRSEPLMVFGDLYGGAARLTVEHVLAQAKPLAAKSVVVQAKAVAFPTPIPAKVQGPAPRPASRMLSSFGPMESSPSLYFSGELKVAAQPILAALPAPAVVSTAKSASGPAPVAETRKASAFTTVYQDAMEDLNIEVAGALLPCQDGFGTIAQTVAKHASVPSPRPRFEPLEPGPEIGVGIAYELNRRSEGLGISTPSLQAETRVATSSPRPTRELNRAVKLTRDAVYAWLNVFTGPALVTVSQSEDQPLGR